MMAVFMANTATYVFALKSQPQRDVAASVFELSLFQSNRVNAFLERKGWYNGRQFTPEVMMTDWNRSNTGFIAMEGSMQLEKTQIIHVNIY